jgi:hypothetical protein
MNEQAAVLRSSGLKSRRTAVYLALSLMTASWVTGLLWAALSDAGPPLSVTLVVLTILILVPLGLSRWLRGLKLEQGARRVALAGAFVFFALSVLSSGFYNDYELFGGGWMNRVLGNELSGATFLNQVTSLVLVSLCWWLGLTLGDMRLTSTNLTRYFNASIAMLVLPAIFFVSDVSQGAIWLYYVFLFSSMLTLGLGRVEEVARRSQDWRSPFTVYWLVQIGLVSGFFLGMVGLAHVLRLGNGIGLIVVLAAPVISVLIFPIVYAGAKLLILSGFRLAAPMSDIGPLDAAQTAGQASQAVQPSTVQSLCAGLALVVMTFFAFRLALFTARRWRQMAEDVGEEETAAMPSLGDRVSQAVEERLMSLGQSLPSLGRLRRRLASRSVRRIYVALSALAAERGYPRPAARTPYEHLSALRRAFPGCRAQVERITEAYVAVHYGQVPETHEELQEIQTAWAQVREGARYTAPAPGAAATEVQERGRV